MTVLVVCNIEQEKPVFTGFFFVCKKIGDAMFKIPNQFRVRNGILGSNENDEGYQYAGAFIIPLDGEFFSVIASNEMGWEHVSIAHPKKCPTWEQMCAVKELFWDDSDCVIQYHPAKKDYVNLHPNCLHLWRPIEEKLPTPPTVLIGLR